MIGCRPTDSPIDDTHRLGAVVGDLVERERY